MDPAPPDIDFTRKGARPQREIAASFFRALYGNDATGWLTLWTPHDRKTRYFPGGKLDLAASQAMWLSNAGLDVYFGVGLRAQNLGEKRRGEAADVCAIPALWIDVDVAGPAHASAALPPSLKEALALVSEFPLLPSLLVGSGWGLHLYWLLRELSLLESDQERRAAQELLRCFQATIQAKARERGWNLDTTSDLARVLRVPGTMNYKLPQQPVPVRVLEVHLDRRYNPSDFDPFLADAVLAGLVTRSPAGSRHAAQDRDGEPIPEGQRNATLTSLAGSMRRRGMTAEEIEAALLAVNARRCRPPLPEDEVRAIARSISRYPPAEDYSDTQAAALATAREKVAHVLEAVRTDPGAPFAPEALEALAELREKDPADWARVRAALKKAGVHLRDLHRVVAEAARDAREQAGPPVRDGLPYSVLGGQICYTKQTPYGPEVIPLANFNARIVAEILRDDGAEQTRVFAIQGALSTNAPLPCVEVPAERYSGMGWVTEKWGTRALVYAGQATKDHLRVAIQHLSSEVPERTVFTHLGWRKIEGAWIYLHGAGAIGAQGAVAGIQTEPEDRLRDYVLPEPPQEEELRQSVRASLSLIEGLAPDRVMVPLLATVYLAPLGECVNLDISAFLAGQTGVFKTELTALAQAHWGPVWTGRYLPADWRSTANALERTAFLAKDAVLVIDDFAPRGTQADLAILHRDADRLLRGAANRAGRARLRPDATARPVYYPRGIIISSGEDLPRGHSLRPRTWIVEVSPTDVDAGRLTEAQTLAAPGVFARAMAAYIRWLAPQIHALKETLPRRRVELRQKALGEHARVPDNQAALGVGMETFLRFAQEVGAIGEEERAGLWERTWVALSEGAAAQARHQEAEEPVGMFLRLLAATIASGEAHVADAKDGAEPENAERWGWRKKCIGAGENGHTGWQPQGRCVGWLEGVNLYLEPDAAYAVAQQLARAQGTSIPVTQRVLWKRMAERQLLVATDRDRNTYKATVVGKRRHVISLHADTLLSDTIGTVGTTGTGMPENQQRQGFSEPERRPDSCGQRENRDTEIGTAWPGAGAECPDFPSRFSAAPAKSGQKTEPESVEAQGSVPNVPIVPVSGAYNTDAVNQKTREREEGVL
ncbi:MAG: primase C-terminal domain-containing protein [Bacillota bacterium]|nr:primase C-terminal domain-containing protein [Bacillota bacterium]